MHYYQCNHSNSRKNSWLNFSEQINNFNPNYFYSII